VASQSVVDSASVLQQSLRRGWLDFLWLEITSKCNLSCTHCYAESAPDRPLREYMQLKDWLSILDQGADLGCRHMQFIGGEPTMHSELPTMIEHARRRAFESIEVYTNGTLFTGRLQDVLLRNQVHLAFSVYAADSSTHETITRQQGSFDKTLGSLKWAVDAGLTVRVGIVQMAANAHDVDATTQMLKRLGASSVKVDRVRGVGRGANECKPDSVFEELCGACWRGKLAVTSTGQIFPCVFSRFWPVGHVQQGLAAVLDGPSVAVFRERVRSMDMTRRRASESSHQSPPPPSPCGPLEPCGPGYCVPQIARCQPGDGCDPDYPPPPSPPDCGPNVCAPPPPRQPGTPRDVGLADARAASPSRLPRLHPGISSAWARACAQRRA
jgi:uncharacterized Fe-S cluster-containing radical SAM superfamily protein